MSYLPTAAMREEAQRYRTWKAEGNAGGTEVAANRASQILSGDPLSAETVRTMSAWFARHEVDKQGQGFSPGEEGYPSPGRVAWAAWGGDPGKSWSDNIMSTIDKDRELTAELKAPQVALYEALEEIAEDLGAFDQGSGAHGAHYMSESPFAADGMVCANCAFYAGPRACEIVSGDIDPAGVCKFWIVPERLMSEAEEPNEGRPYPQEHAARLKDPSAYDRFRRRNNAAGKGVDFIFGIKTGEQGTDLQAIRFRLSEFTASEARQWLREHDYTPIQFEEATGERTKVEELSAADESVERAKPSDLSTGDFVSWNSSGGTARGRIEHVMREGTLGVPDSEFSINATAEDPAALIRIYREGADGWDATETLVGHKFSTLRKIEALRTLETAQRDLSGTYTRTEATNFRALEERTFEFPFSSEYPVARYFGNEVLSHDTDAADLGRLNDGAPLLFNHNPDKVVGVVERAYINDKDKRGYAKVRFSRNKFAQEVLDDVKDGILRGISFGYAIDKMEERNGDYVATKWSPHEVSVVSIPADPTIGIGRSLITDVVPELRSATTQRTEECQGATPIITNEAPVPPTEVEEMQDQRQAAQTASTPIPEMENTPDLEVIRSKAAEAERTRIAAITALGSKHQMQDLARELIDGGRTLDEARAAVLEKLGSTPMEQPIRSADITTNDVGLSDKETKRFSFVRALNFLANQGDASARRAAEFEIEVGEAAAKKYGRSSNGIVVPNEVLRRDLIAGTPSAGGNLVNDVLLSGSFIDLLRNRLALANAGVTMLSGLQGNISIPRQASASTAYWVGENVAPPESQQSIDQVNMTPKTVGAFVDYSRRLLLQSSIDVEGMVRNDLARVIALELDRAGIYGTGSTNQPLGLVNTTGIGSQTISTFGTFAEYIGMETDVATANADAGSMRYIINAAARGALKSTAKSATAVAAGFVYENDEINGYPAVVSNQLLNNDALFGDFSMMIMGMWSGLDLTVDPYAGATAGTVRIIALQDVDFAIKQPGAFCYGT
jgi:HK97 family phage major capsid protein/HK97 family phage prohead protease